MAAAKKPNPQNFRKSQEKILVSPDQVGDRAGGEAGLGDYRGLVQTLPRLPPHKKSQSQQNVCTTSTLDRHQMIKMNSHPTSGKEQERNVPVPSQGGGAPIWMDSPGGGTGTLTAQNAKRLAFATKRQNNIEQFNFIPGVGGAGGGGMGGRGAGGGGRGEGGRGRGTGGGGRGAGGGTQTLRTARKNEVTV